MMAETRYLDDDISRLYELNKPRRSENLIATLFWGDSVRVIEEQADQYVIELWRRVWDSDENRYTWEKRIGSLPAKTRFRNAPILKVRFVDVGQGDAAIVETPKGRVVLIDGGEEEHLRRYINVAYSHVLRTKPLHCDAVIVPHGDADHFAGLTKLVEGFRSPTSPLITANRVFHNGLVKKTAESLSEAFGKTARVNGVTYAVELEDNLLGVPDERMNKPFREWKRAFVLKLTYGNVNFLFGADLNEESQEQLLARARDDGLSLTAEVLKVPHHGSADFSPRMLEAIRPVVSVVSSGDESAAKEYIYPRAGLMGALGKHSRASVSKPLVYATEMVAFFRRLGEIDATAVTRSGGTGKPLGRIINAYRKQAFGIVHVRTDGKRVLVATHSGRDNQKESYAFRVDERGEIMCEPKVRG